LVLNVNARGALFHEKLGEFHGGCETTVARVSICYDGAEVVDDGVRCEVGISHTRAGFALLAVMEELSSKKVFNLIGYSVIRIVFGEGGSVPRLMRE
jgi:hypothetical protein